MNAEGNKRLLELNSIRKSELVDIAKKFTLYSAHPLEKWKKYELIDSIMRHEFGLHWRSECSLDINSYISSRNRSRAENED